MGAHLFRGKDRTKSDLLGFHRRFLHRQFPNKKLLPVTYSFRSQELVSLRDLSQREDRH
jgi:hypothetical protein